MVDPSDSWVHYVERRSRVRRSLISGLGRTALAVVIFGGIFSLMAAGGDGNPSPGQSTASIFAPHTNAALAVALFAVVLGVAVALVLVAIYLMWTSMLARSARRGVSRRKCVVR